MRCVSTGLRKWRRTRSPESREQDALRLLLLLLSLPPMYLSLTPNIYALLWAMSGTPTAGVLGEPTFHWFQVLYGNPTWTAAIAFSTGMSIVASGLALAVVMVLGYFERMKSAEGRGGFYQGITSSLVTLPLLFPPIVYAISLQFALGISRTPEVVGLFAANVVLVVPVQYFVLEAAHERLPASRVWSAATLGASPVVGLARVYGPAMSTALLVALAIGALMAFDEVVIATFVWNGSTSPVAKELWMLFGRSSEPVPAALAISLASVLGIVAICAQFLRGEADESAKR